MSSKLLKIIRGIKILPIIIVNHKEREVTFIGEGIIGNNLAETYYLFRGYRVRKPESPSEEHFNVYSSPER